MLTSTYTLVALSVEQTAVRAALHSLAEAVHALPETPAVVPAHAAGLCARLREAYDHCHWRKLDKFLIPVLRRCGAPFDALLHKLDGLSEEAARALRAAAACLESGERGGHVDPHAFRHAALSCVSALRHRLDREEHDLFPLARGAVGGEAWFAIANQMLAHDAHAKERRGEQVSGPLRREAPGLDLYPVPVETGHRWTGLSILH